MGFPEAAIGRLITGGASLLLPRAVGLSRANSRWRSTPAPWPIETDALAASYSDSAIDEAEEAFAGQRRD